MRRACVIALLLVVQAGSAAAQSLWQDRGSLFTDHRARRVNDVLTIVVLEESSSNLEGETRTSKDSSNAAAFRDLPKILGLPWLIRKFKIDVEAASSHEGKGSINRKDQVMAQIAARVMKVLDNGNLLIEGRRAVVSNGESQFLVVSGIVRPEDVSAENTVKSTQVAEAEIRLDGRGVITEKQRPGILQRLLDWLWIF